MEEAVVVFLLQSADLTLQVGNRITWNVRPQGSDLPAIVLHKIDGAPVDADEGETGLFSARVQVDCWSKSTEETSGFESAKLVKRAAARVLSGAAFTYEGIEVQGIFIEDEQDSLEEAAGAEELDRVRLDFIIWHT